MTRTAAAAFPAKIRVRGYAASEMDIAAEALEMGDWNGRLVSQWTGAHVVVYDSDHAKALAGIACEWSNELDRSLDAGEYDDCPDSKRMTRAAMVGLGGLFSRLLHLSAA